MKTKLTILLLLINSTLFAQTDLATLKTKCFNLYRFLEKRHYKPIEWNDSSSAKLFVKIIDELDEDKLIFTKADLKILEPFRYTLDDEITGKQWNFLKVATPLYKARVRQLDSADMNAVSKPFDYQKNESIVWPAADFVSTQQELQVRIQQYNKWMLMGAIADSLVNKNYVEPAAGKLPDGFVALEASVRQKTKKRMQVNTDFNGADKNFNDHFAEMFFNLICWMYDPHSTFMNFSEKEDFESKVSAADYTTGIDLTKNDKGEWEIKYLLPGGPAWRSGDLHAGDIIIAIKTSSGVNADLETMNEQDIEDLLQGTFTDKVSVTVKNAAGTQKTVALAKEKISSDENIVRSFLLNGSRRMGYIQLPGFYTTFDDGANARGCAGDVAKEIIKLKRDTISGLILDLRNNGGGSIQEALELAGIFINEGPLCLIKERSGKLRTLKDPNRGTIYDGPLMILINGSSASASELTAATLQDYHRALIVGGNSYGKGTAQVIMPLDTTFDEKSDRAENNNGDFVKVTESKFYRVDGSTVQWKGVVPDISLPDAYQQEKLKERYNSSALKPDSCKPATYTALPVIPVAALLTQSNTRVGNSNYFKTISTFVQSSAELSAPRMIPLKWSDYSSYYKRRNALFRALDNVSVGVQVSFKADNNSVDKDRISILSPQSKTLNDHWLDKLANDAFLEEACNILQDWLAAKK